jgi:superfamily II DNA/RNA helicase
LVSSATGGVGGNGITSVVVVPNQELAFQLVEWTRELFPSADEEFIDGMIQAVVTPSPSPVDPTSSTSTMLAAPRTSTGKKARHRPRATTLNNNSKADKDQIQKLAAHPPHVLVATPTRLWDLLQRGVLDLSGIETLVLDEVDHLIRLPNRFASRKQVLNRDLHPKPAELAVREILRSAQDAGRYPPLSTVSTIARDQDILSAGGSLDTDSEKVEGAIEKTGVGADRIQIVAASATMNRPMRHWLETTRGWVQDPTWVDTTKSVVLPEGIEHHCVIVGPDSVRNMRFDENQISVAGEEEVDMAETDRAWNNQSKSKDSSALTSKEKEAAWKERNLAAPGVISSDVDSGAIEKFRDDDDRMLEGVAMACQLDDVKSACVFFCTSFSLKDLATRLEFEFGLPVKTIQNAFPTSNSSSILTTTGKKGRSTGIYLAHEENARGLDLPGLSHVFIVGLPSSPSSYLHMAGRTGRMGEQGEVVTILRDDEFLEDRARSLFRMLNVQIEPYRHVE